jgi:hypothetical protein
LEQAAWAGDARQAPSRPHTYSAPPRRRLARGTPRRSAADCRLPSWTKSSSAHLLPRCPAARGPRTPGQVCTRDVPSRCACLPCWMRLVPAVLRRITRELAWVSTCLGILRLNVMCMNACIFTVTFPRSFKQEKYAVSVSESSSRQRILQEARHVYSGLCPTTLQNISSHLALRSRMRLIEFPAFMKT